MAKYNREVKKSANKKEKYKSPNALQMSLHSLELIANAPL